MDRLVLKAISVQVEGQKELARAMCLVSQHMNVNSYNKLVNILVPVIPKSLVRNVMHMFHDTPESAHLGIKKTMERIKQRCFWEGMNKYIREYIRSCEVCQQNNPANF